MENKLIGEILMANGIINQDQLTQALNVQKKQGGLIGLILIELNIITANQLTQYLSLQQRIR